MKKNGKSKSSQHSSKLTRSSFITLCVIVAITAAHHIAAQEKPTTGAKEFLTVASAIEKPTRPAPSFVFDHAARKFQRAVSGLLVYEETALSGSWRTRYWSPRGLIKPDYALQGSPLAARFGGADAPFPAEPWAAAFGLTVNGQQLLSNWTVADIRELPEDQPGRKHAVAELHHERVPIAVEVHTRITGHPFLERWLVVKNRGTSPLSLGDVAPLSGFLSLAAGSGTSLPPGKSPFTLLRPFDLGNNHREANLKWVPLPVEAEYSYGGAKHGQPFALVRCEMTSEWFVIYLGWSGSYTFDFAHRRNSYYQSPDLATLSFRVRLGGMPPLRVLAPGESCVTPSVYIGHLTGELDDVVQSSHSFLREAVLPPLPAGQQRPVEFNHFGYVRDQIDEANLRERIDVAAAMGAELFTVDAGWISKPGEGYGSVRGDWQANTVRFPNGLEAVFRHARDRGLKSALWCDVETIDKGSQLFKNHPDWIKRHVSSDPALNPIPRETWTLDATNPAVLRFIEETIAGLVDRYRLDVFRLDFNAPYDALGVYRDVNGIPENTFWRHYDNIYSLYDRIRALYPMLLMENCASGGGRNDLGMLRNFHYTQVSDEAVSDRAIRIANGFSLMFPPEWGMNFVGTLLPETHRYGDLDFQFRAVMFGHMCITGLAPTVAEIPPALLARAKHHVTLYKDFIRPMLSTAKVFHHTPVVPQDEAGEWVVLEYATPDANRAYAGVFRLRGAAADEYRLRFRGVAADKEYKVTLDNTGQTFRATGLMLRETGILVRLAMPLTSELVLLVAQ